MNQPPTIPTRPSRSFLPEDFKITSWDLLQPHFERLLHNTINDVEALKQWMKYRSELESVIAEDMGWRYIRMTCFTDNEEYRKDYQDFVENIQPHIAPYTDLLNRKLVDSPYAGILEHKEEYKILMRNIRKEIELFRESNIPLFTEINTLTQRYGQISGAMTVEVDGQELTLQQASVLLMDTDRTKREHVYLKTMERRLQDKEALDDLFTDLVRLRNRVSANAGFKNFRDYMFKAYGRFDYSAEDCFRFHSAIEAEVVPQNNEMAMERARKLGVEKLRPWDKVVDPEGRRPLRAFAGGKDLVEKAIVCFRKIDPYLGQCLEIMQAMDHLDMDSRKGKAPGGYNYPLAEIGVPFIFMNATSTLRDMITLMHEGGHAVHNFLTIDLPLQDFKSPPMEVAELASMAMELISMDHWNVFFEDEEDLRRAKLEHLEDIMETLPWVATIDKFQHWIYENPDHTPEERKSNWNRIADQFADQATHWDGLQEGKDYLWQKQLHLYEVPFYYIEYGMAQLGAIALWRNYRTNAEKGLQGYKDALKLGYTKSIPEIYKAAGIQFNFSKTYIRELMGFVKEEIAKL